MAPTRNQAAVNALRLIPAKWAVVLVGLAISYVVLQPRLNQWFGWNLPSVANMTGDEQATVKKSPEKKSTEKKTPEKKATEKKAPEKETLEKNNASKTDNAEESPPKDNELKVDGDHPKGGNPTGDGQPKSASQKTVDDSEQKVATSLSKGVSPDKKSQSISPPEPNSSSKPKVQSKNDDSYPLYGFLVEIGPNRYESPAGLVYGPGSEEKHRLKHIARHLEDQPDRPGSHGVFQGSMKPFLITIDDAYTRAKKGSKGTTKRDDDGAIVYEVTFEKAIGFVGGETGGRKKNPPAKKIRLVVRGSNVITAFPF